jgi:hypothetical protein
MEAKSNCYMALNFNRAKVYLKTFGFQIVKADGEFEIYPFGKRSESYFTNDLFDAVQTAEWIHEKEAVAIH